MSRSVTDSAMQTLLPGSSPASYVPNALNQYTSVDNTNPLYYDDNGNLTEYDGWSYGYDAHNRLVSASQDAGTSLDLDYDPNGRLISTTLDSSTTDYVYSGDQLIGEYDPLGNPINLYVYAPGSDIPIARFSGSNGLNDMQYLRADERGSIVVETDGTLVLESHQYDVYGVPLSGTTYKPNTFATPGACRSITHPKRYIILCFAVLFVSIKFLVNQNFPAN